MGNKAVLNISKFSMGGTGSMAALLLPTGPLDQDVATYDVVKDFMGGVSGLYSQSQGSSGKAIVKFLSAFDLSIPSDTEDPDHGGQTKCNAYMNKWAEYQNYDLLSQWFKLISLRVEGMYARLDDPLDEQDGWNAAYSLVEAAVNADQDVEWRNARVKDLYQEALNQFRTDLGAIEHHAKGSEDDLDDFMEDLNGYVEELNEAGFEGVKQDLRNMETLLDSSGNQVKFPQFYRLLRFIPMQALDPLAPLPENKELVSAFETLRSMYNGRMLDLYAKDPAEYPYVLDLGFDRSTKETTDVWGDHMHTLVRLKDESSTPSELDNDDKLRIRDMFRMDRMNKVSAYETLALNPSVGQKDLDNQFQVCGVLSRLMQDDRDCRNIAGIASTSYGTYYLTAPNKADGSAVKAIQFQSDNAYTGTFRNFGTPTLQHDAYFGPGVLNGNVNFLRRFGGAAGSIPDASDGEAFSQWYAAYNSGVLVKVASLQGSESMLKIIGKRSYSWFPGTDAIRYLNCYTKNQWNDKSIVSKSYPLVNGDGNAVQLRVLVGIGDDNYVAQVPRKMCIEIPFNPNYQYTYLTFDVRMRVDDKIPESDKHRVSVSFSLDDESPVVFYPLTNVETDKGYFHNLVETNSLYVSLSDFKKSPDEKDKKDVLDGNGAGSFQFIIENNLLTGKSRKFHIAVTSDFIPSTEKDFTPDELSGYENTRFEIINPEFSHPNSPSNITYGNYLEMADADQLDDFWNLSATMTNAPEQYILEVPYDISLDRNLVSFNNYTTATMFSDVLTAKNHMDSEYRMQVSSSSSANEMPTRTLNKFRRYTGIDSCSDTLSLYYDAEDNVTGKLTQESRDVHDPNLAQEYEVQPTLGSTEGNPLPYKRIETIKAVNRFQHDIKHKSNLFSVVVNNSGIPEAEELHEQGKVDDSYYEEVERAKNLITNAVEAICRRYAPVNNQLFKVYFK